jgi:Arm DNA-binding domain
MPLTDTAIRSAKPGQKTLKIYDERGLYLEISPAGGKWWRLKYRFAGKEKRLSLGVYPDVNLKKARERRQQTASTWVTFSTLLRTQRNEQPPFLGHSTLQPKCLSCRYESIRR